MCSNILCLLMWFAKVSLKGKRQNIVTRVYRSILINEWVIFCIKVYRGKIGLFFGELEGRHKKNISNFYLQMFNANDKKENLLVLLIPLNKIV